MVLGGQNMWEYNILSFLTTAPALNIIFLHVFAYTHTTNTWTYSIHITYMNWGITQLLGLAVNHMCERGRKRSLLWLSHCETQTDGMLPYEQLLQTDTGVEAPGLATRQMLQSGLFWFSTPGWVHFWFTKGVLLSELLWCSRHFQGPDLPRQCHVTATWVIPNNWHVWKRAAKFLLFISLIQKGQLRASFTVRDNKMARIMYSRDNLTSLGLTRVNTCTLFLFVS